MAILKDKTTNNCDYYLVSDIPDGYLIQIKCRILSVQGELIEEMDCHRVVMNQSSKIFEQELKEYNDQNCILQFTWTDYLGNDLELIDLHLVNDFKDVIEMKGRPLLSNLSINETNKTGSVEITNSSILRDFWIYSNQLGVHFENNFVFLLPNTHTLQFTYSEQVPVLSDFQYKYR